MNNLTAVKALIMKVVTGIVERKIDNTAEITACVHGDNWALDSILSRAAAVN